MSDVRALRARKKILEETYPRFDLLPMSPVRTGQVTNSHADAITTKMTPGMLLGAAFLLLVGTATLCVGQAWAISGSFRWLRHLLVWILATGLVGCLCIWLSGETLQGVRNVPFRSVLLLLALPGTLFGFALALGAWRAGARGFAIKPWGKRILALTGLHLAVVFVGGALLLVVGLFVALSGIH